MAYIYKITNDVNGKQYVGKTENTIEERFQEHCRDSRKERCEKRPLYRAMNKYGIEHFRIELIEETDNPEEREIYWIKELNTYGKTGYNATMGGDGKKYLDYDLIIKTYQEVQNLEILHTLLGVDKGWASKILKDNNIPIKSSQELARERCSRKVAMLDKNTLETIKIFKNSVEAAEWLYDKGEITEKGMNTVKTHVSSVCNGHRKTCAGYSWKYI